MSDCLRQVIRSFYVNCFHFEAVLLFLGGYVIDIIIRRL